MDSYAKVFSSIIHSTVWQEPMATRLVWITMLVLADRDGVVSASVGGLARAANVSREETEAALACFSAPDPDSKTTANEGRRAERIEGGWRLLNYELYRDLKSPDDVREKAAARQKRWRDKRNVALRNVTVDDVTHSGSGSGSPQTQDQALSRAIPPSAPPPPPPKHWHEDIPPRGHIQGPGAKTAAFLRVFEHYPNKMAEHVGAAQFQHFAQRHPKGEEGLADELLAALPRLSRSPPYDGGPRFWPSFERFLDERRWIDQPTESRGPPQRAGDRGPSQQPEYPKLA